MYRLALASLASLLVFAVPAEAQSNDSDLVRLPGQGTLKAGMPGGPPGGPEAGERAQRFVPAGGLLLSFDSNDDGIVTPTERSQGTVKAFTVADSDGNGTLSAFEQQEWAENLPTHDDSLANPVRFDPNLDRMVSLEEFRAVIDTIAEAYASHPDGSINVADLHAPEPEREPREREGGMPPPRPSH